MNNTEIIFELSISLFESYLMIEFISKFNGYKYLGSKKNILFISAVILLFVNITVANYIEVFIEIPSYIAFVIMIIYSIIALRGKFLVKLFSSIIFNVVLILINSFSLFILGMIFNVSVEDMITTFGIYRFVCLITSKLILFYISRIILKLKNYKSEETPLSIWTSMTIIPILTIFIMVTITESAVFNNDTRITFYLLLSIIGLILINIIIYFLFMRLGNEYEIIKENELLKYNNMLRNKHSKEIKELYKEVQTMRHDMKNQIISICSSIQDENFNKAIDYANGIIENIDNTKKFIFTKNDMFNAIVNNKLSEANYKGIKTSYSINYELDQRIEDVDINILFGNLFDNAIEACEKLKNNKEITLVIDKKRDYIFIEVKNTIDKSILKENPNLLTTKHNKLNHGIGVKSIKKIVEKYDGIINYYEKGNIFSCNILLLEEKA
ncbi:signal transduction histidine kinase [Sedimentibacter acidaminivorans]|uniref:Signal transduction histidine kinase n=1 Tax=Sedimentibacter acidaminivorans TaxID=913099 RepID=A0ABS4GH78_9FIRM|nr:sensor histidine kinase [Sedimentibacter acidaminivorans]MBP1926745.1 signal transduction histidine kinase [Sedimentibacter acidaminivorans]